MYIDTEVDRSIDALLISIYKHMTFFQEQDFEFRLLNEQHVLLKPFPQLCDGAPALPGIIYRRPQGLRDDLLAVFLLPFSKKVWFCIVASLPVVALAIQLATRPLSQLRRFLPARHRAASRGRTPELGLSASPRPRRCSTLERDKQEVNRCT